MLFLFQTENEWRALKEYHPTEFSRLAIMRKIMLMAGFIHGVGKGKPGGLFKRYGKIYSTFEDSTNHLENNQNRRLANVLVDSKVIHKDPFQAGIGGFDDKQNKSE